MLAAIYQPPKTKSDTDFIANLHSVTQFNIAEGFQYPHGQYKCYAH